MTLKQIEAAAKRYKQALIRKELQDAREEACRNADNALALAAKYGIKLK